MNKLERETVHSFQFNSTIHEENARIEILASSQELCESGDSQTKEVFFDALALAGTFSTVEYLVEKIRAREVSR